MKKWTVATFQAKGKRKFGSCTACDGCYARPADAARAVARHAGERAEVLVDSEIVQAGESDPHHRAKRGGADALSGRTWHGALYDDCAGVVLFKYVKGVTGLDL